MMPCGHPLAARAIRFDDLGDPETRCWACEVERDIELTERARVITRRQYWKEAQRASRARARGYNTVVGVSDVSATMRDDAASGAYSTGGRVAASTPGVRR
jgi:hypothetical protein